MKKHAALPIVVATIALGWVMAAPSAGAQGDTGGAATGPAGATGAAGSDSGVSGAIEQKLLLTPAQRAAIYQEISKDKSKTAAKDFSPVVGADVPPMIELYALPDDTLAEIPAAKLYKYVLVENKVVLVDPTRMRVVDVIEPTPRH
jgi:hypothetical protein